MNYRDVLQCLKGVGPFDLSDWVMPITGSKYGLKPVICRTDGFDAEVANMLTTGRNENIDSFLTYFKATPERTKGWLTGPVANDSARIMFSLRELESNELYGYMGLAYGDASGNRIEGDAIVRYAKKAQHGLMRNAFLQLVQWTHHCLDIKTIWVRVLSENSAVEFYKKCHFSTMSNVPLYRVVDQSGHLVALTESGENEGLDRSSKTLVYMKYSPLKPIA